MGDCEYTTISDCYATGESHAFEVAGGLVGDSEDSTITRCYATGDIDGVYSVGGLIGESDDDHITACHATGLVEGEDEVAGGLVGDAYKDTISNCYATGDVNGVHGVGGLVGICFDPTFTNCYATGNIFNRFPFGAHYDHGGLIGYNLYGTITGCSASGDVIGVENVGGLIGWSEDGTVSHCSASGKVQGRLDMGGLIGYSEDVDISDCDATGNVEGIFDVGGLVGLIEGGSITRCSASGDSDGISVVGGLVSVGDCSEIKQCYATGNAEAQEEVAGGLMGVGYECLISDCYAWGSATGDYGVGGLVGITEEQTIIHCYAIGLIDGNELVGGFAGGYEEVDDNTYIDCFWDIQTSGTTEAVGYGNDTGITGHHTDIMQTPQTFLDVDWDFETIWGMVEYPQFRWGIYRLVLSSTAGGDIVVPGEGTFYYNPGTTVALGTEVTDPLFFFSHFEGYLWTSVTPAEYTITGHARIRAVFQSVLDVLYVDANAPEDQYENGTEEFPFDSIQEAIDVAAPGTTLMIRSGTYVENLDLSYTSLTLTGVDINDANDWAFPVIQGSDDGPAVTIKESIDPNTLLQGLIISQGNGRQVGGIDCDRAQLTLTNCLIVGNRCNPIHGQAGALRASQSEVTLTNCTLSDNYGGQEGVALLANSNSVVTISNSILWNNDPNEILTDETSTVLLEYTSLNTDPNFVSVGHWEHALNPGQWVSPTHTYASWMTGDYHLTESSPCIDAGDPNALYDLEPDPNGFRINMGVYGNTPQATAAL